MIRIFSGQPPQEEYLAHFGINGMKWGVRRYQNPDGTLTEEGKKRYGVGSAENAVDMGIAQMKRAKTAHNLENVSMGMFLGGVTTAVAGLVASHMNDKLSTVLLATGMGSAVGSMAPMLIADNMRTTFAEIATKHREHMYDETDSDYQEYRKGIGTYDPFKNAYEGNDPKKIRESLTKKFKLLGQSWTFGETSDIVPGMLDYYPSDKSREKYLNSEYARAANKYKAYTSKQDRSFTELRDYFVYTHGFPLRLSFFEKIMNDTYHDIPTGNARIEYESKAWDKAWDMVLDACSDTKSLTRLMNTSDMIAEQAKT